MKIIFSLSTLIALFIGSAAYAQNGTDRGGGDPIAAEVFSVARGVAKKLSVWSKDGTIQLTDEQVKKVQDLVNCPYSEKVTLNACLWVVSAEKVYRFPEKAPSLDAIEVTMVNITKHTPPMIEVSRSLWPALEGKPLDKEMMVLHELIGASGITNNGIRIDDQFFKSYELKNKTLEAWAQYKDRFSNALLKLYNINMGALHLDVTHLKTFAETLEITSPDMFQKIAHPENYEKRKKDQDEVQRLAYNQYSELVYKGCHQSFVGKNMQTASDYYKDTGNAAIQDYGKSIVNEDLLWHNWSIALLNEYIADYQMELNVFQKDLDGGNFVENYLIEKCPNPYTGDMAVLTTCSMEAMKTGIQIATDTLTKGISKISWKKSTPRSVRMRSLQSNRHCSTEFYTHN